MKLFNYFYADTQNDLFMVYEKLLEKYSNLYLTKIIENHIDFPSLITIRKRISIPVMMSMGNVLPR